MDRFGRRPVILLDVNLPGIDGWTLLERLRAAGATEVVPEALEGSLMLASHALALVGVPMRRVIRAVQEQRDARYNLLKGYFHGADDDTLEELEHERLTTVSLPDRKSVV